MSRDLETLDYKIVVIQPFYSQWYVWYYNGFLMIGKWYFEEDTGTVKIMVENNPLFWPKYVEYAGVIVLYIDSEYLKSFVNTEFEIYVLPEIEWHGTYSDPLIPYDIIEPRVGINFVLGDGAFLNGGPYRSKWYSSKYNIHYTVYNTVYTYYGMNVEGKARIL